MPILNAGASASISLPAGQFIQVTGGAGVAQVLNMPGASPIALDGDVKIGPFDVARTVSLSATASLSYNFFDSSSGSISGAGAVAVQSALDAGTLPVSKTRTDRYYFFGRRQYAPQATFNLGTSIYRVSRVYLGQADAALHSFRLAFPGHTNNTGGTYPTEAAAASNIIIEGCSIGYSATLNPTAATWVAGTFAGAAGVTIDPAVNPTGVLSDDIIKASAPVPAGYHVWAMVAVTGVSASTMPLVCGFGPGSIEGNTNSTSASLAAKLTDGSAIVVSANGSSDYGPTFVVCKGRAGKPVVLAWGDSIGHGQNETNFSADNGNKGFIGRGLSAAGVQVHNACVSGSKPEFWLVNGRAGSVGYKLDLIKLVPNTPFTHILHEGGTNSGGTWNTTALFDYGMKAYIAKLRSEFGDVHIAQTLIAPKVTTADGVTSLTQTPITGFGSGGFIPAFNSSLLSSRLDGTVDSVIDHTAVVRDASDANKIRVHPTTYTLAADYVANATTINLTEAPGLDQYIVIGTTAVAVKSVSGSAGNYAVTLVNGSTSTPTTGQTVKATYCPDGTHFTAEMHKLMAPSVTFWANTL